MESTGATLNTRFTCYPLTADGQVSLRDIYRDGRAIPDTNVLRSELEKALTVYPNHPKPGVSFVDVGSLLADPALFGRVMGDAARHFRLYYPEINKIVVAGSRGFLFAYLGVLLEVPVVMARSSGTRLPGDVLRSEPYVTEYDGADSVKCMTVQQRAVCAGDRVLLVDDVCATGSTLKEIRRLVEKLGAKVVAAYVVAHANEDRKLGHLDEEGRCVVISALDSLCSTDHCPYFVRSVQVEPFSQQRVYLASASPCKVAAVRRFCEEKSLAMATVVMGKGSVAADGGSRLVALDFMADFPERWRYAVPDQPVGMESTCAGAVQRALRAYMSCSDNRGIYVGIENGLVQDDVDHSWTDEAVVCVVARSIPHFLHSHNAILTHVAGGAFVMVFNVPKRFGAPVPSDIMEDLVRLRRAGDLDTTAGKLIAAKYSGVPHDDWHHRVPTGHRMTRTDQIMAQLSRISSFGISTNMSL